MRRRTVSDPPLYDAPMRTLAPVTLDFFEQAPLRIPTSIRLAARPEKVFSVLADASTWPSWFPLMHHAAWTSADVGRLGAEREVAFHLLGAFQERFIAWEPGVRFAFTMVGTTSPLVEQMAEDYRLTPDGDGSRLDWIMAARQTALGRPLTPPLRLVMGRLFGRAVQNLAARLA
jgi:hypothetical protein